MLYDVSCECCVLDPSVKVPVRRASVVPMMQLGVRCVCRVLVGNRTKNSNSNIDLHRVSSLSSRVYLYLYVCERAGSLVAVCRYVP